MRDLLAPAPWWKDQSFSLLREGYAFLPRRLGGEGPPIFRTRLMLRDVICLGGVQAAKLLYDGDAVTRRNAMPPTVLRLLQDKDSVQQLDDAAHRHRKAMFMQMLVKDAQSVDRLVQAFHAAWLRHLDDWQKKGSIVLAKELPLVLAKAAYEWTGIPANPGQLEKEARLLARMISRSGHFGPGAWITLFRRRGLEQRLQNVMEDIRGQKLHMDTNRPAAIIANHRDPSGAPLSTAAAAVELINLLRPIVAVGRYIVFAGLALLEHPRWRTEFAEGREDALAAFAEEVRRTAPFFPFVGGVLRRDVQCYGQSLNKGQWLLLDLYGTCHASELFPDPEEFRPERNLSWQRGGYDFIPQGAGDAATSHRCPGEAVTIALMEEAIRLLTRSMAFDVPTQDLSVPLGRVPTGPRSGLVLGNIRIADHVHPKEGAFP